LDVFPGYIPSFSLLPCPVFFFLFLALSFLIGVFSGTPGTSPVLFDYPFFCA